MPVPDLATDIVLGDERVLLRPLTSADATHLLPFSLKEPGLWRFSMIGAAGEEALAHYIALALEARAAGREYPFIVFDKRTNVYAGSTRFYDIQPQNRTLQLGYTWYGQQFQGTGLNAHCKFLLLQQAFDVWDMERVEFRADARNARSIAAMKGIGCTVEGILRSTGPTPDGGRRDSIVLSILRDEWSARVRALLAQRCG
ncbi:MAG TPA: GNAT family protein [Flavobacteriales bacterium]|jgi:RimJ/RimL family protein N-acetyltransferase|nr:GNAT family protein [Flavobacteriales bacterium]